MVSDDASLADGTKYYTGGITGEQTALTGGVTQCYTTSSIRGAIIDVKDGARACDWQKLLTTLFLGLDLGDSGAAVGWL